MLLFNLAVGIILLALLIAFLRQPVCPRCGRLWPERVHAKKVWADELQPVPRFYRATLREGERFYTEYIQFVIYQFTYRCQNNDCLYTWNQCERVSEVVERER